MGRHRLICSANKCYNTSENHPNKSFFIFPKDIERCRKWLDNCGRKDLSVENIARAGDYYRICEDHFELTCFTDSSRKLLNRNIKPVPTIFINNIRNLYPAYKEHGSPQNNSPAGDKSDNHCSNTVPTVFIDCSLDIENKTGNAECFLNCNSKPKDNRYDPPGDHIGHETEPQDLDVMCRLCMNEVQDEYIELFSQSLDAKEIRKFCDTVLSNKVKKDDLLPQRVCQICSSDLKTCYQLIEKFRKADNKLRALVKDPLLVGTEVDCSNLNNASLDLLSSKLPVAVISQNYSMSNNHIKKYPILPKASRILYEETKPTCKFKHLNNSAIVSPKENIIKNGLSYGQIQPHIESRINTNEEQEKSSFSKHFESDEIVEKKPLCPKEILSEHNEIEEDLHTSSYKIDKSSEVDTENEDLMVIECEYCFSEDVIFRNEDQLEIHYKEKHNFQCSICSNVYISQTLLEHHKCKACETCGKKFSRLEFRIRHQEVKHPCNKVESVCWICGTIIKGSYAFENHIKFHNSNSSNCDVCFESFENVKDLTIHKQIHYPKQYKRDFLCEFCSKRFTDNNNLLKHLASHEKQNTCTLCKAYFTNTTYLLNHKKICKKNKTIAKLKKVRPYSTSARPTGNRVCSICGRRLFVKTSNLNRHRFYHFCKGDVTIINKLLNEQEIHKCAVCDKLFYSKISMSFHNIKHLRDSKSVKCEFCDFASKYRLSMIKHMQKHIGDSSFKCHRCCRSFLSKYYLTLHRRKHKTNSFICKLCNIVSESYAQFLRHVSNHLAGDIKVPFSCQKKKKSRFFTELIVNTANGVNGMMSNKQLDLKSTCPMYYYLEDDEESELIQSLKKDIDLSSNNRSSEHLFE